MNDMTRYIASALVKNDDDVNILVNSIVKPSPAAHENKKEAFMRNPIVLEIKESTKRHGKSNQDEKEKLVSLVSRSRFLAYMH